MILSRISILTSLILLAILPGKAIGQTDNANSTDTIIAYESLYDEGISYGVFLDEATRRKSMWDKNTEMASVPRDIADRVEKLTGRWHLLAVAVDACSDSANIIPYLATLTASSDILDLRIIDSTIGRPIMEANRTPDDRAATPTIAVLSESFEPVGFLIERPTELQDWALVNKAELSTREFLNAKFEWYDEDRGHSSMDAIITTIESAQADQ